MPHHRVEKGTTPMRHLLTTLVTLALVCGTACNGDGGDDDDSAAAEQYPDVFCPGDPSGMCEPGGDTTLYAGAAAVAITPDCWEEWVDANDNAEYGVTQGDTYLDCGCDRLCPGDEGYTAPDDGEGDGTFQTAWLAGSSNGRAVSEIHDDLWARAVVLNQGETTLAIVSVDLVGYFRGAVKEIEAELKQTTDIDYLLLSSTHTHQAPDTIGMWGPSMNTSGITDRYWQQARAGIIAAVEQAAADRVAVDLRAAEYDIAPDDCEGQGVNNFNMDHRDPNIVDERLFSVQLVARDGGGTVATLLNWPNHPETMIDEVSLTSGFPHYLREGVENGVDTPAGTVPGVGGVAIYVQGMCGGMMTPLGADPYDVYGTRWTEYDYDMVKAIGDYLATFSLTSLAAAETVTDPVLRFRVKEFGVLVENIGYWMYINLGVLDVDLFTFDMPYPGEDVDEDNMPTAMTEVIVIDLGPVQILTIPGEMLPEIGLGGYDGSHTGPLQTLVDDGELDITEAPDGPYLVDLMSGEFNMVFGLSNDELGYIIPEWEYELGNPEYLNEAEGDHYEETNSVGPTIGPIVEQVAAELLAWEFPP